MCLLHSCQSHSSCYVAGTQDIDMSKQEVLGFVESTVHVWYVPHRLMDLTLGSSWGLCLEDILGGRAFLEKVCPWMWVLRAHSISLFLIHLVSCLWWRWDLSTSCPCCFLLCLPRDYGAVSQNKALLSQVASSQIARHSNITVTNTNLVWEDRLLLW